MTEKQLIEYYKREMKCYEKEYGENEKSRIDKLTVDFLEEHKQYRSIGTVEKCREAVEKQIKQSETGEWIPCSERLPEEHKLYDITTKNEAGIHSDSAIFNPYLKRWLWDADETELVEIEVLAWAEKRQPYKP